MKVRLVGCTQPMNEFADEGMNDVQDLISYCARVSNPANQMNMETTERLLNYLAKHKHWSPFEMASATLEITTTRDIARQILRHRSFAFQEFSQRYANPQDMDKAFVVREARLQDETNRQNSIEMDSEDATQRIIAETWVEAQQEVIDLAKRTYEWAIDNGIAKEQARAVLPEGNTVSRLCMQGSIRSWIHFIELRSGNGTQKEHMEVAREVGKAITEIFPLAQKYINN